MENPKRTCDSCTACCEGWLSGQAHGHHFFRGRPCFFLNNKCTIYKDRPQDPCVNFKCTWLEEEVLPMWMRPDLSNIIVRKLTKDSITYYEVTETEKPMSAPVLNWLIQWALNNTINLYYKINNGPNKLGTKEFIALDLTK